MLVYIFQPCRTVANVIPRSEWALTWLKNVCYNGRWFVLLPRAGARDWISPHSTGGITKHDNGEGKRWQIFICQSVMAIDGQEVRSVTCEYNNFGT